MSCMILFLVISDMSNNVSELLRGYLKKCGMSEAEIAQCKSSTRLYHDLGIYGEIAKSYIDVLANSFSVDMTRFVFLDYFPPEFEGDNLLSRAITWIIPFAGKVARSRRTLLPLTLGMIDHVMQSKRWAGEDRDQWEIGGG